MPVRIYSFAKELGIDNKKILEVCEKLGLKGKGSALASLTDDEVTKVKSYLEGNGQDSQKNDKPDAPKPMGPKRDDPTALRGGQIRDLNQIKKSKLEAKQEAEAPEAPTQETPPPQPEEPTPKPTPPIDPKKPIRPTLSPPIRPSGDRTSGAKPPKKTSRPQQPKKPTIRVAALPEVKQPNPVAKSTEKVQKPDISLPKDAIRSARQGKAPLQQFTDSKKSGKNKKKFDSPASPPDQIFGEMPTGKGGKDRRSRSGKDRDDVDTGMGSTRQARRPKRNRNVNDDEGRYRNYNRSRRRGPVANTAAPRKEKAVLELPCTVRTFSEAAGVSSGQVIKVLMELGTMANINAQIEDEMVELIAEQLGVELDIREQESLENKLITQIEESVDDEKDLKARPPVVTFLGHVDHGKTSLLDAIIGIDVVSGEAGGITQHIRAYEIKKGNQTISFVDTPGHEAFTEMRARGANVTDIAVLVVAADDGVMPQTEEAISHAKAAGVPIIVALNKIDLASAQPDKALQDLAQHELLPSEWGGEIEVVRTSATVGTGIDELLETILVTAELHEYKANPNRNAVGTCLEAEQEPGRGVIAKMIVQNGTLNVGDVIVCGSSHGRVKALYNTMKTRKKVKSAGPSVPVNITGLDFAPEAGDKFYVLDDIAAAREIAASREFESRQQSLSGITTKISLDVFQKRLEAGDLVVDRGDVVTLNLILRADVRGSIEAIKKELGKLDHPEVEIKFMQALVGGITEGDVRLAQASQAVIIGFNVVPDETARSLADDLQVEIRRYDIIYKVTEDIKATLEGRLKPDEKVVELGMAMVLRTFDISRSGRIAGCRVMRGNIERGCRIRVIRDSRIIGEYNMDSLKREKDDAKTVQKGMECGIKLAGFNDVKEGDQLEAYKIEEVARTL